MSYYYTALINAWSAGTVPDGVNGIALTGLSTVQKLIAINGWTTAGPNADVAMGSVAGTIMLMQAYVPLQAFSQSAPNGNTTHDNALNAAKMLMAMLVIPSMQSIRMSDPNTYATVNAMMEAILAQETASPGSTGFTQAVYNALIALPNTQIPWWKANGYPAPFTEQDLIAAGGLI